jgi:ComF family protein
VVFLLLQIYLNIQHSQKERCKENFFVSNFKKMVPTIKGEIMMKLFQPFVNIVFPNTCACCGTSLQRDQASICDWCAESRFEEAVDEFQILPENVEFVFAMWQFDKGAYLQDLLHDLKYNFLKGVGRELGYLAGRAFIDRMDADTLQNIEGLNPLIVPVPLHRSKERKRGYNQSGALAEGFSKSVGWPVISDKAVIRTRKTKTQTGLTTGQRARNLKGAFGVNSRAELDGAFPLIIDDVFTTGATTFELASAICRDEQSCGIVTIAKA